MKRFSILLTIACILTFMSSCNTESEYTINGVAEGYADGTKVYLQLRDKPDWINIDSTTITKGRFTMKGQADPGFLGHIYINGDNDKSLIVVEPGVITIEIKDAYGYPHGTECNERLTTYSQAIDKLEEQMADIMERIENLETEDTAAYFEYRKELEKLDQEEYKLLAKLLKDNITNPLGVGMYCLLNSAFADDIDFLFNLSQQIPEEFLQQHYVAKVLENVGIISITSVGNHFTDLVMTTREGENISLEMLVQQNKYVLIDFWASWCAPCRQSIPGLRILHETYKDRGLSIVGISLDEDKEAWEAAIEKYKMDWIQVCELQGWKSGYAKAYGVRAIPATILIDSTGMIIGRNLESTQIAKIIENSDKDE